MPEYLRDFAKIERWMMFFNLVFSTPSNELSVKSQTIVARIYFKMMMVYCNDSLDYKQYKGWAAEFRNRYAAKLFEQIYVLITVRVGDEETLTSLVDCVHDVVKHEGLRYLVTNEHIENLFYRGVLLPLCESNKEEIRLFSC